jgi:hypothetical protein
MLGARGSRAPSVIRPLDVPGESVASVDTILVRIEAFDLD